MVTDIIFWSIAILVGVPALFVAFFAAYIIIASIGVIVALPFLMLKEKIKRKRVVKN